MALCELDSADDTALEGLALAPSPPRVQGHGHDGCAAVVEVDAVGEAGHVWKIRGGGGVGEVEGGGGRGDGVQIRVTSLLTAASSAIGRCERGSDSPMHPLPRIQSGGRDAVLAYSQSVPFNERKERLTVITILAIQSTKGIDTLVGTMSTREIDMMGLCRLVAGGPGVVRGRARDDRFDGSLRWVVSGGHGSAAARDQVRPANGVGVGGASSSRHRSITPQLTICAHSPQKRCHQSGRQGAATSRPPTNHLLRQHLQSRLCLALRQLPQHLLRLGRILVRQLPRSLQRR